MILEQNYFREYELQNYINGKTITAKFPCSEEEIQKICDELEIENNAVSKVNVKSVNDPELQPKVAQNCVNIDDINYLEKRLDSLGADEIKLFYAAAEANGYRNYFELINLTSNLECYSLIDSSKDMDSLGKELYLHEAISCPTDQLKEVNGQKYLAELMRNNNPWETSHGLLYPNKNTPTNVYHRESYPPFFYGGTVVEVLLQAPHPYHDTCEEVLELPHIDTDLNKIIERMVMTVRKEVTVAEIHIRLPEKLNPLAKIDLSDIRTADDLVHLNEVAQFLDLSTDEMKQELVDLVEELQVDRLEQVNHLASGVLAQELEFVPDVYTVDDYGHFLVCVNESTKIDEDIASFVDYERYGESQLIEKSYVATENGLVIHDGDSPFIEELFQDYEQKQCGMTGMT